MLEHGLRTPTGHIARQTRRIDEIRPRMTVVEEEVSWLRSQFAEDLHQMHQEPDLLQLPVRASMGSLELHSDAMGSARRLRRPCARRIDEVPKGARLPARRPWLTSRASLRAAPATTRLSNTTPPPRARSTSPTPPLSRSGAVSSVGGSCFVAGAGRRRRFVALRPRARVSCRVHAIEDSPLAAR